ncbi:uncharacterized protein LOC110626955 [Manihot esculenta]|uniref:Uncharacterized protein n=1 Tax=Manihot esculenta TaxID=3983 RepID=A0A2C9UYQ6_MANES|nr:uncharacterized protein LOC110626955 [Manihot esculenta]OAY36868.1 hypothetical protein MANES_11G055700v8 [Manihot esculenta]
MSSILSLNSQSVILATAMVVSSTVLFLAFSKHKTSRNQESQSPVQNLRSCLCSEGKKRDSKKKKKKKRVKFAENVKDTKGNGEEYRREKKKENSITRSDRICRNEIPPNRIALYNGILRDRLHRMECSC